MSKVHTPVEFDCGSDHCGLITEKHKTFTWGYGMDGQLGCGNKNSLNIPKQVQIDDELRAIRCGGGHTGFITKKNELYVTGRGRDGQLRRGDAIESMAAYRTEARKVGTFEKENLSVMDLALGANHSIALVSIRK